MEEAEVVALREALQSQSATLSKIYAELEEERKAAASGAHEALSMITRLQEEKAAEKMEACQYKRMAEEKLQHSEQTLGIMKEIIFQKEREILYLRYYAQYYEHMLIMGVKITDADLMRMNDHWFRRAGSLLRKTNLGRNISLPATQLEELSSEFHVTEKLLLNRQTTSGDNMEHFTEECDTTKLQVTRSETAEVDKRATEWSAFRKFKENRFTSKDELEIISTNNPAKIQEIPGCSWHQEVSGDALGSSVSNMKFHEHGILRTKSAENPVNDQEPDGAQRNHNWTTYGKYKQNLQEPHLETKCVSKVCNTRQENAVNCSLKHQENLNKAFLHGNKLPNLSEEAPKNCHLTPTNLKNGDLFQSEIQQLIEQMRKLEDDTRKMKQENQERGREQLNTLKKIIRQLDAIKSHVTNTMLECHQEEESFLNYLKEEQGIKSKLDTRFNKPQDRQTLLLTH